ncbi:MAG TPA: hypothetical protein VFN67_16320 [Polyangiales bacterium]|nr:hypothetical protein [Polyangiales bacterium]
MARSERVFTLVYGVNAPTAEEWARCLRLFRERAGCESRFLVETRGGGPDAKQRKVLAEVMRDQDTRVAVMTDSIVARGILTALAWLGLPQRGFALNDLRAASEYLGLSSEERQRAAEELARLRDEIGFSETKHAAHG